MTTLAFVLIFDENNNSDLINYSEEISKSYNSVFTLGEGFIPHATLVQFRHSDLDATKVWREAYEKGIPREIEVIGAGICFLPAPENSETWLEIPLLKSSVLDRLQRDTLHMDWISRSEILNGTKDAFRPHITLGLNDKPSILDIQNVSLPGNLLRRKFIARVALAETGPYYSVPKIIFE